MGKNRIFFRSLDTRDLLVAGVQAGVPGYSVNLLLFTYWYFSSGHPRFTSRWCPNLNLVKISLSLSRLKSTHTKHEEDLPTLLNTCTGSVTLHVPVNTLNFMPHPFQTIRFANYLMNYTHYSNRIHQRLIQTFIVCSPDLARNRQVRNFYHDQKKLW